MDKILVLRTVSHRPAQDKILSTRIREAGYERCDLPVPSDHDIPRFISEWIEKNGKPLGIIRWEEHGGLFGEIERYRRIVEWCYENKVAPLYIDFGYFDHYNTHMIDLFAPDGSSSIFAEWNNNDDLIELESVKGKLGKYIKRVSNTYRRQASLSISQDLKLDYKAVAFIQCKTHRCRLMSSSSTSEWVYCLHRCFGSEILFKTMPSPADIQFPKDARVVKHDRSSPVALNAKLAVNAQFCITNNSSITNELLIAGLPVVSTGRSWYSGLKVFEEPESWEEIKDFKPRNIDRIARLKYASWWMKHQFYHNEHSSLLGNLVQKFHDSF